MTNTYSIDSVWITLTYPNDIQENFHLRKPQVFEFGFRRIARRPDYRDAFKRYQKGNYYYQLIANYSYEWHEMDLRKLVVAKEILLKFPPAFGQIENYNSAKVLLDNESVPRNWFQGLVVGSDTGEVVPQGAVNLRFVGVDAFTEAQAISLFGWNQSDSGDPDDEDPEDPTGVDLDEYTFFGNFKGLGGSSDNGVFKATYDQNGVTLGPEYLFSTDSLGGSIDWVLRLRNGNVLTYDATNTTTRLHLFDSQLNYIKSFERIESDAQNTIKYRPKTDEHDNIYVFFTTGPDNYNTYYLKLDSNLNIVYTSQTRQANRLSNACVTPDYVYTVRNDHPVSAGNVVVARFNRETGAYINEVTTSSAITSFFQHLVLLDDRLALFTNDRIHILNFDLTSDKQILYSSLNSMPRPVFADSTIDNHLLCIDSGNNRLIDWVNETVLWEEENHGFSSFGVSSMWFGTDRLLNAGSNTTTSGGTLSVFNLSDGLQYLLEGGVKDGFRYIAVDHDNWQCDVRVTQGTPPPPPTSTYQGSIEVTGPADANFAGTAPGATIIIRNSPSQASDTCGTGGTEFNIEYKGTDYCTVLPVASKSTIALQIAQFISSSIPGLTATDGVAYDGAPAVFAKSTTLGDADNGETITMGVPFVLEQNGPVFNRYVYHLSGGEPSSTIDEPVDVLLGKTVFATTANVTGSETAASIAQKIFDAMDAINMEDLSVSKTGDRIDITCVGFRLAIALDIGNTGFDYTITQMTEV